jgi:peptidoglycan hydrolase-like protein with peptidoglycan-binding domain
MIELQERDNLPTVAVVQTLLNNKLSLSIPVDGDFGSITKKTIQEYQKTTKCSNPSGNIDFLTWNRLALGMNFKVHDVIDVTDPKFLDDVKNISKYNPHPFVIGGMSNGVEALINMIVNSTAKGSMVLLRFDGHGGDGVQGVSFGRGWVDVFGVTKPAKPSEESIQLFKQTVRYSTINLNDLFLIYDILARLKPCFSPYGSIEFHGCHVAGGVKGKKFIQMVSNIVKVPVTGSLISQSFSASQRFEGPVITACPNGLSLKDWSRNLPEINICIP